MKNNGKQFIADEKRRKSQGSAEEGRPDETFTGAEEEPHHHTAESLLHMPPPHNMKGDMARETPYPIRAVHKPLEEHYNFISHATRYIYHSVPPCK